MKINFRELKLMGLDGEEIILDISKSLGNYLYETVVDLGVLEIAREIYREGEIALTDETSRRLLQIVKAPDCALLAIIKEALIKLLDDSLVINEPIQQKTTK